MSNTIIGLDIGHSSIKVQAATGRRQASLLIPSHSCPEHSMDYDAGAEQVRKETLSPSERPRQEAPEPA